MKRKKIVLSLIIVAAMFLIGSIVYNLTADDVTYIYNNEEMSNRPLTITGDLHKIAEKHGKTVYTNYPYGYEITFPGKPEFNFDTSSVMTRASVDGIDFTVTKEYSPYEDAVKYVAEYTNRYMMDPKFIEENNLTIHRDETVSSGDFDIQYIIFTRNAPENTAHTKNTYAHCYLFNGSQLYYRLTFNVEKYSEEFGEFVTSVATSVKSIIPIGKPGFYLDFYPVIPDSWNEETARTYQNICDRTSPAWGIFCPQSVKDDKLYKINNVEEKIDNNFVVALDYMYFGEEVPIAGMKTAYEQGKLVELTMQISTVMHLNLNGYNPFFEVLDGTRDDYIRKIARELRDFEHPFMFRLNNEMNTDWTSYGGACIINEPELFKEVWIRMYKIFEEEGVNNAMWIFNPNDRNCPPNEYNHFVNYYPGNEYVHIFGVTGYNTGTYYAEIFGEEWREFETIYDNVFASCEPYFSKFPWIITEFSSSSVGGDKVQWINNMFEVMPKYDNIKIAVWFCSVDYDFRYDIEDGIIARPYLLDETPETAAAFSKGLKESGYRFKPLFD